MRASINVDSAGADSGGAAPRAAPAIGLRRLALIAIAWGLFFCIVLVILPASPELWIPTKEAIEVVGPTGDSSAIVAVTIRAQVHESVVLPYPTWPIRVYDLATGQERLLHGSSEEAEPMEWLTDEFGYPYRADVRSAGLGSDEHQFQISGDYLAVVQTTLMDGVAPDRLRVLNWRSGETLLDEPFDHLFYGGFRFFRDALLVEVGRRLEVWNLLQKKIIRGDWLEDFKSLTSATLSSDGRWLLPRRLNRVWNVSTGTSQLELPLGTEAAAFSRDGTRLGVVGRWRSNPDGEEVRQWQVFDIGAATLLKEADEKRVSVTPVPPGDIERLEFGDDDATLQFNHLDRVSIWKPEGIQYEMFPWRPMCGPSIPTSENEVGVAYSGDDKWGVASRQRQPVMFNWRALFPWNRRWSINVFPYELYDLGERRKVASLGRGSVDKCWFTPDSSRVVTRSEGGISVWDVPPGRPWRKAFLWSLLAPIAAVAVVVRHSRRDRVGIVGKPRREA